MNEKLKSDLKNKIRDEFVHGYLDEENKKVFPTVDNLAKRYDIPITTLYRCSTKENWQKEKNEVQTKIQLALDESRIEKKVTYGKQLDDSAIHIAQEMLNRIEMTLYKAQIQETENGDDEFLTIQDLRDASHAAQNAQKLGKLALGQAQEISKVSADVSNPEAFSRVMEQLDELAESRSQRDSESLH